MATTLLSTQHSRTDSLQLYLRHSTTTPPLPSNAAALHSPCRDDPKLNCLTAMSEAGHTVPVAAGPARGGAAGPLPVPSSSLRTENSHSTLAKTFVTVEEDLRQLSGPAEEEEECGGNRGKTPHVFSRWMDSWAKETKAGPKVGKTVTDVCSASITMASTIRVPRPSTDSSRSVLDPATVHRAEERMHVVEELISTEEYYVQDLKALRDQCIPVLWSRNAISNDLILALERNITDMIHLHTRLLADITTTLPSIKQIIRSRTFTVKPAMTDLDKMPVLASPHAAGEVATAFDNMISGFFEYEEYAARYVMVSQNLKKHWNGMSPQLRKGSEVLVGTTRSCDNRQEYGKRAMELDDMLVKPIQRMCKYPLLFREILRNTPAIDCPESNRMLEKVLGRLDNVVTRVNEANRQASKKRQHVENSWLLQDRLIFSGKTARPTRLLGHVILCGVLHVVWQMNEHVYGAYMVCMLFDSYLLLATITETGHYEVKFAIALAVARIEQADRGKGLHSPSAPFSWKIVFECDHRLYEVLLTAFCSREESVWRDFVQQRMFAEAVDHDQYTRTNMDVCTVYPGIKPIGGVNGRLGSFARRQSLYGTMATSLLDPDVTYVVISDRTTTESRESITEEPSVKPITSIVKLGLERVPTFHMRRANRNNVVAGIKDVWTKELLPLNGTEYEVQQKSSRLSKVFNKSSLKGFRNKSAVELRAGDWNTNNARSMHTMQRLSWSPSTSSSKNTWLGPKKKQSHPSLRGLFAYSSCSSQDPQDPSSLAVATPRRRPTSSLTTKFSFGSAASSILEDPEAEASSNSGSTTQGSSTPVSVATDSRDSMFSATPRSTPASSVLSEKISVYEALAEKELLGEKSHQKRSVDSIRRQNLSFRRLHKRNNSNHSPTFRTPARRPPALVVGAENGRLRKL